MFQCVSVSSVYGSLNRCSINKVTFGVTHASLRRDVAGALQTPFVFWRFRLGILAFCQCLGFALFCAYILQSEREREREREREKRYP